MKYKIGDKVKLKSKEGLDELKQQHENLYIHSILYEKAGSVYTIRRIYDGYYSFEEMPMFWAESLIEGLAEDTDERLLKSAADACKKIDEMMEARYQKAKTYYDGEQWSTEFECPKGYIFKDENGNVINATKIILEKKKKEYPKTFEECVHVLEGENRMSLEQMNTFRKLIDARNAYWKIAGEEMGLGKPWSPDLTDKVNKHCIEFRDCGVCKVTYSYTSRIFAFPTEEMRDAFKENFKEEIEKCKELL